MARSYVPTARIPTAPPPLDALAGEALHWSDALDLAADLGLEGLEYHARTLRASPDYLPRYHGA